MKRLLAVVVVFVLVSFLFAFVPSVIYGHPSWMSFSDPDHSSECNNFTGSNTTVYMEGVLLSSHDYKIAYYENKTGAGDTADLLYTDLKSSNPLGILDSQLYFANYTLADAGLWHAVVYNATDSPPSIYTATDPAIVEDDDFTVCQDVIPEFPTVIAGIGVAGLCFGIYYWMRRERLKFKMQNSK